MRPYSRWKHTGLIEISTPGATDGNTGELTLQWRPGMAGNFRDIRFTDNKGRPLKYNIHSKTDFLTATVFISLPTNDKLIRIYYGNGTAKDESDTSISKYIINDDFNDGVIDSIWNTASLQSVVETGGYLVTEGPADCWTDYTKAAKTSVNLPGDFTLEAGLTWVGRSSDLGELHLMLSGPSGLVYIGVDDSWANDNPQIEANILSDHYSTGKNYLAASGSCILKIVRTGGTVYLYYNGGIRNTGADADTFTELRLTNTRHTSYNGKQAKWNYVTLEIDPISVQLISTRPNPDYFNSYVSENILDTISASSTVTTSAHVLIERIIAADTTQVSGAITGLVDKISVQTMVNVISQNNYVDKISGDAVCNVTLGIDSMKAFADIDNYKIENVNISKSINDAMWQLTATIDGKDSPVEFRHLNFSRADIEGVTRHLFTGIIPDTRYTLQIAQNKIAVTAFDYGWYLSAQYVPSDMLVMNLDGDYSSWDEWIKALLEETGIIAYKLTTCTEVSSKEFVFDEKTTKQDAINEIAEATGFIFSVQWVQVGNTYEPAAYFIDPDYVDDSINGLDLPADTTISWPDKSLIDIPTLQSPTDEKINRVKVRGCDSNGNWYSATVESSEVSNREMYPREYYYESGDLDTQTKVNARAASLFAYFTSDSYTVEATFIKRFDLRLFQKIRFTGSGFPSKLTDLGWLRIISITYSAENVNDHVTIKAVVNRDVRLLLSEVNTYLGDSLSNEELIIDSKLNSLNITPMIGTVQSIDGNIATILTEDGKTIKARIINGS